MTVDEDFEDLLRHRLHAQEPVVSTSSDLPSRLIATGSTQLRRRRRRAVGWTALVTVAVVAGSSLLTTRLGSPDGPPASEQTPGVNEPSQEQTERLPAGAWANQLPRGAAPDIAFLAGTTLHRADGTRIELEVADAELIGETVAGTVLLVEDTVAEGEAFSSRYVLAEDDGNVVDMPVSTLTAGAAQEAVVSPDGRYFTNGGPVIDKQTNAIIAEMPEAAEYLHAWTPAGVLYSDHGSHFYLWRVGSAPIPLRGRNPGQYENGTDIGIRRSDGCTDIVRIEPTGQVAALGHECLPKMFAVSPDGERGLTPALDVVDTDAGTTASLTDRPISDIHGFTETHWEDEETVLIPIPGIRLGTGLIVRCDLPSHTCERATDPIPVGPGEMLDLP